MSAVWLTAGLAVLAGMGCMFLIGLWYKDNSLVDIAYGPLFILAGWSGWLAAGADTESFRPLLLLALVSLWGLRLGAHIGLRHRGRGEDFRYRNFRSQWGRNIIWRSLLQIYLLQGLIVLIIATPILVTIAAPGGPPRAGDFLGLLLFLIGFAWEAIADWQLMRFKRARAAAGRTSGIIRHGLWRYSRHPNYFGEALLWWGFFVLGLASPWGLFGLISPLVILWLLLRVSGIPMLEAKYRDDPEYAAYRATTSAFIPWPPRRSGSAVPLNREHE